MPINKFGASLGKSGAEPYYQWSGLLRNFVRDNALCMGATDFDKKNATLQNNMQIMINELQKIQQMTTINK